MTVAPTWPATHTVPAEGMAAYATPDPATPPVARLDPHLPVQRLERRGEWMHVVCANGWTTWVDGRLLVRAGGPATAPTTAPPSVVPAGPQRTAAPTGPWPPWLNPLVMVGGALALVGGLLPWLSVQGFSVTAWDIPIGALLPGVDPGSGPKTGVFLLVGALVLVPLLTRRRLPIIPRAVVGIVAINTAGSALMLGLRSDPRLSPSIGLLMTLLGGLLVLFGDISLARQPAPAGALAQRSVR
jgi:hypothetical protein